MKRSNHEVDLDKVNQHFSSQELRCPLCQREDSFSVLPKLMELREYGDGDIMLHRCDIVPLLVLTCLNCGNTVLVNALAAGLTVSPEEK